MKALHLKLKELREENGWSIRQFAKMIPMSHVGYAKIEAGTTHPAWDRILRFADIFRISPAELVHAEVVTLRGLEKQHKIDDLYEAIQGVNNELVEIKRILVELMRKD